MKSKNTTNPLAIVLGGTVPHIALLENLKIRGYHTVLIDYLESPPGKMFAHEHLRVSTLDQEAVYNIAKSRNAHLVISTCVDQANVTACFVAERLGLPAPYNYNTALTVTNKSLMKAIMVSSGIPTSKYFTVQQPNVRAPNDFKFPLIVKPVDGNSSKGVRKISNSDEISLSLVEALRISRTGEAIVEEFKEGREIGVDCFVQDKIATVLMIKERRKIPTFIGGTDSQQIYGCFWPAEVAGSVRCTLEEIANKIVVAFGLDNTPLMIQVIVNEEEVNVIEFGVRIGGGESFRIIKMSTGFDYIDAAINSYLAQTVDLHVSAPRCMYADNFIYCNSGVFGKIVGFEPLLEDGTMEYIDAYKVQGSELGMELSSNNRAGVFVVKGNDSRGLFDKIETCVRSIDVIDISGRSIMRKDIYYGQSLS